MERQRILIGLITVLILAMAAVLIFALTAPKPAEAQGNERLRDLLNSVNFSGRPFEIQFVSPLIPGEPSWLIGDNNDPFKRVLSIIGDDYLCVTEPARQTYTRCTPYHNILAVNYIQ